ncbi:MAG: Lrp/AsnC family transcriptional regulator [Clostridia bacterium]|nr:Lrp/AsnC family transcriptional regulator [Clostridia bacterium]
MDETDARIIELLSEDAAITSTEIGAAVGLSIPAVNKRIQKLKKEGVIRRFTILTDGKAVGKPITAYILVILQSGPEALMSYIEEDPDVLECAAITGEYDYIIKVCAADVGALEDKLLRLKRQKGVVKSHTMLSLMECKLQPTVLPQKETMK